MKLSYKNTEGIACLIGVLCAWIVGTLCYDWLVRKRHPKCSVDDSEEDADGPPPVVVVEEPPPMNLQGRAMHRDSREYQEDYGFNEPEERLPRGHRVSMV